MFKKAGRPNLLDSNLIEKVKDTAIGTRADGGVIYRRQILNIVNSVIKVDNSSSLKKFDGTLELTNRWARDLLDSMEWNKRKGTTGKIESSAHFLSEEKFKPLIVNLDQIPLSYVLPGKYRFSFRGSKNASVKGVDGKR